MMKSLNLIWHTSVSTDAAHTHQLSVQYAINIQCYWFSLCSWIHLLIFVNVFIWLEFNLSGRHFRQKVFQCLSPRKLFSYYIYCKMSLSVCLSNCLSLCVPACLPVYPTFHLSEHFLENSAKLTDCSGFFFRCSSRHVWTKKAYADVFPFGLLTSLRIILAAWRRDGESNNTKREEETEHV